MLKTVQLKHTPDQFHSSAWIAHNAAMRAKQPILGKGQKPRIGIFASWRQQVTPAIEIHTQRPGVNFKQGLRDVLMLVGAVVVFGSMFYVGVIAGF